MEHKKKIIIDTDGGSDDAAAIAMALNDPNYEIVLITTVAGNVSAEQAAQNTLTTIEYSGTYTPPVYIGMRRMIFRELKFAEMTHGADGLGDLGFVPDTLEIQEGNGVLKILETLRNSEQGEVDIITLGPLTNLAMAILLEADTMRKAGRIVAMGTAGLGPGNVSPVAEFNIWQDAESARIVTEAEICNLVYVGWDACLGDCILDADDIQKIRRSGKLGEFVVDCNRTLVQLNRKRFGYDCLDLADPSAMAAALYPECIEECEKYYCQVDTSSGPSYGSMLVDKNRFSGKTPNAYICSKLFSDKYKGYIYKTLCGSRKV